MTKLISITNIKSMKNQFAQLEVVEPQAVSARDAVREIRDEINAALARGHSIKDLYEKFIELSKAELSLATFRTYLKKANGPKRKPKKPPETADTQEKTGGVNLKETAVVNKDTVADRSVENGDVAEKVAENERSDEPTVNPPAPFNASQAELSNTAKSVGQDDKFRSTPDGESELSHPFGKTNDGFDLDALDDLMREECDDDPDVLADDQKTATEVAS